MGISIEDIEYNTLRYLERQLDLSLPPDIIVYKKSKMGYFIVADMIPDEGEHSIPEDLMDIFNIAQKYKCTWIMVDPDCPSIYDKRIRRS